MSKLIIQQRGSEETFVHECLEETIIFGRLEDCTIQLNSRGVSRQHAKIVAGGEHLFLVDMGSGNGTLLNGILVASDEKNLLKGGDVITIDEFDIRFQSGEEAVKAAADEEVTDSDVLEVKLLKKVLTALDKEMVPSLEVLNGVAEGKKMFLPDDAHELCIGRDPDCDFPVNEYVVSRKHANIIKRWGGIAIRDLESKNGTFVNNRRVIEEYLHDGDRIALGTVVMLYRNPQEINLAQMDEIRPKARPAPVAPQDIPGLEDEPPGEWPAEAKEAAAPQAAEGAPEGESSAVEEWDNLEKSMSGIAPYPTPYAPIEAIKRLTPMEIGMIGLGALVLIFALITIVNLIAS